MKKNSSVIALLVVGGIAVLMGLVTSINVVIKKKEDQIKREIVVVNDEHLGELANLITHDWKRYQDDKFGFHFKHPSSIFVCDAGSDLNGAIRFLAIYHGETCEFAKEAKDPPGMYIKIKENKKGYVTAEEAFWGELGVPNGSLDGNLGYFKIGGLDAYGGEIKHKTQGEWVTYSSEYSVIILKNEMLFVIQDGWYGNITGGESFGNKPLTDAMLRSLYFSPAFPWKSE